MEDQILDSPITDQRNLSYAGFWIRVAAYVIDYIIIWIVMVILSFVIGTIGAFGGGQSSWVFFIIYPIFFIGIIGYYVVMESSSWQATLGKRAVGIKVGNAQGQQISFANAAGRYFAKILSSIILGIGFMMAGWDDKKQGLHDKLANTYVYYA